MPANLSSFFSPQSIAVVGASRSPEKVGGIVLANITKSHYPGKLYPVNPEAGQDIGGLPAYPNLAALPQTPDLALIALPAALVLPAVTEVAQKGTKNVVVLSAGFKESGPEGQALEQNLVDLAHKFNLNVLGPNCLGFVNKLLSLNLTFAQTDNIPGNVRFLSQSGAIASSIFDWCQQNNLGFSDFITLGNKAVLSENDILSYWQSSQYKSTLSLSAPDTSPLRPIGLYLESISQGSDFLGLTQEISKENPIFILKPGATKSAAKAMQSHTGAIAGEDSVLQAALTQAGILRCEGLEDFFDFTKAFSWETPPLGPNIAVVSNAGGPGVIIADAIENSGLTSAQFDDATRQTLAEHLPRTASILNPVDVLGDALADRYATAMETVLKESSVDALIVILTPQVMTQIDKTAETIAAIAPKYHKPIFCSFIGGSHIASGEQILNRHRIPSFHYPERAVRAVAAMWHWRQYQTKPQALTAPLTSIKPLPSLDTSSPNLSFADANRLIAAAGITLPPSQTISDSPSALNFANSIGWPVVLKLSSPQIVHKTDVKGVITHITAANFEGHWHTLTETKAALEQSLHTTVSIIIQKEITDGQELIVGVKRDPTFGPVLLFGSGGLYAEILSDHHLALLPLTDGEIADLLRSSKVYPLLSGLRGRPPLAISSLTDLITRLSALALSIPAISEIEINPVILTPTTAYAVDSHVIIAQKPASPQI